MLARLTKERNLQMAHQLCCPISEEDFDLLLAAVCKNLPIDAENRIRAREGMRAKAEGRQPIQLSLTTPYWKANAHKAKSRQALIQTIQQHGCCDWLRQTLTKTASYLGPKLQPSIGGCFIHEYDELRVEVHDSKMQWVVVCQEHLAVYHALLKERDERLEKKSREKLEQEILGKLDTILVGIKGLIREQDHKQILGTPDFVKEPVSSIAFTSASSLQVTAPNEVQNSGPAFASVSVATSHGKEPSPGHHPDSAIPSLDDSEAPPPLLRTMSSIPSKPNSTAQ